MYDAKLTCCQRRHHALFYTTHLCVCLRVLFTPDTYMLQCVVAVRYANRNHCCVAYQSGIDPGWPAARSIHRRRRLNCVYLDGIKHILILWCEWWVGIYVSDPDREPWLYLVTS